MNGIACRTHVMQVKQALMVASIAGATGIAIAVLARRRSKGLSPISRVIFEAKEDEESDSLAEYLFEKGSSCPTEKELIRELECRVKSLRNGKDERVVKCDIVTHVGGTYSNAFTVWEYRDLFVPNRKIDIALYEEYIDFMRLN